MSEELKELRAIKKILILQLMKGKASQEEIARILGVDQSAISHMINPKSKSLRKGEQSAEESQDR